MSARTDLLAALDADLADDFHVSPRPPAGGSKMATGKGYVTIQRAGLTPAPQSSGWGQTLAAYLLVGAEDFATAEDALEPLLATLVEQLEAYRLPISTIDRDVFFEDGDAPGWHGYRIAFTKITSTP